MKLAGENKWHKPDGKDAIFEVVGWAGALLIVLGFALNSFGIIANDSMAYQLLNLVGASAVVAISIYRKVLQTATLNMLWAIIAMVGVVRLLFGG